ncbi:UspA domain-containing protein [Gordonia polyisoprenivorans VH2]|uniref:UspA domain-containing protein n=1 Tax=Gordonia polyisoprenivorans (strain DSM 44266 / VH2) TaxID=1112204 RepID=H6MW65_GORPV|nr:universal stress protein [Gordonia polyisoprenivorans]AFA72879.1 UspA domain-containing protein [Gordonia polyisoprenivorans VH2]
MPSRKLLAAYLPTPGGEDALALGIALAGPFHAALDVCMVLPPPPQGGDGGADADPVRKTTEMLDAQAADWLSEAVGRIPDEVVAEGHIAFHENAAEGLVAEAESTGSAAIIVGGSGGGIRGRHALGSVVNDLLHISTKPVVITPLGAQETARPPRRITCAIGRRPGATPLLRAAVDACSRSGLPLRLVSLVTSDDATAHRDGDKTGDDEKQAVAHATEQLAEHVATIGAQLPDGQEITSDVITGDTIEDAVASLEWTAEDIIFVGSSRLARPQQLFFGATASKMLRALAIPMVVVPKDPD